MPLNKVLYEINRWFADNYGFRRGALLTYWYRVLYLFGWYRAYRQVDWGSIDRLVFVCKGNICRSAYAEAVAKSFDMEAVSCGIDTQDGVSANQSAIIVAAAKGFDLQSHRTSRVQSLSIRHHDLFIAMEPYQVEYLKHEFKENQCTLLGLWGKPVNPHIQDPYGASETYFHHCFYYLEKSVYEIVKKASKES